MLNCLHLSLLVSLLFFIPHSILPNHSVIYVCVHVCVSEKVSILYCTSFYKKS